jgi:hypothetical protein
MGTKHKHFFFIYKKFGSEGSKNVWGFPEVWCESRTFLFTVFQENVSKMLSLVPELTFIEVEHFRVNNTKAFG